MENFLSSGAFGHGFTYSGHPVACAVSLEAIKIYKYVNVASLIMLFWLAFYDILYSILWHITMSFLLSIYKSTSYGDLIEWPVLLYRGLLGLPYWISDDWRSFYFELWKYWIIAYDRALEFGLGDKSIRLQRFLPLSSLCFLDVENYCFLVLIFCILQMTSRERNIVAHVNEVAPGFQKGMKDFRNSPIVGEVWILYFQSKWMSTIFKYGDGLRW